MGLLRSIIARVGLDGTEFDVGAKKVEDRAEKMGEKIGDGFKDKLAEIFSAAAVEELSRAAVEYGEKIYDTARRVGETPEQLQRLDHALKMNSASLDSAIPAMERYNSAKRKALEGGPGSEKIIEDFRKLGISLNELKGMRSGDFLFRTSEFLQDKDPQQFIAALRDIGGRGIGELVPALKDGLGEAAENAKNILPDEVIVHLKQMGDQLKEAGEFAKKVGGYLVDGFVKAQRGAQRLAVGTVQLFTDWMDGHFKGSLDRMRQAMEDEKAQMIEEDESMAKKAGTPNARPEDEPGESEAARKSRTEEERKHNRELERQIELHNRIHDAERHRMTAADRRRDLQKEILRLSNDIMEAEAYGDAGAASKLTERSERLKNEVFDLDKEERKKLRKLHHVDALQKIGVFVGGAGGVEDVMANLARQHLAVLNKIEHNTSKDKAPEKSIPKSLVHRGFMDE